MFTDRHGKKFIVVVRPGDWPDWDDSGELDLGGGVTFINHCGHAHQTWGDADRCLERLFRLDPRWGVAEIFEFDM